MSIGAQFNVASTAIIGSQINLNSVRVQAYAGKFNGGNEETDLQISSAAGYSNRLFRCSERTGNHFQRH